MQDTREPIDLLVRGAGQLATPLGHSARGGSDLGVLQVIEHGAVAIRGGLILETGPEASLQERYSPTRELDAEGGTIVPGFVDAHTHPVFAGTREDEFEMRTRGATYLEIAAAGGGILSTVRGVRAATTLTLAERLDLHLLRFLELGTTTLEAKSGYGLTQADELRSLEILAEANQRQPIDMVPTFLGAHAVPPEFAHRRSDYIDLLTEEMLPAVAAAGLAEYCDVFTEVGAFDIDESRRVLMRARELGLKLRLHVDQLSSFGGAELAAELGAESADHLEFVGEAGIRAMAKAGVIPVLCPLVPLYLRVDREVPARRMIEAGLAPALATDFNPGSCYAQSMPEVMTWAALRLRLTAEECLVAATLNAAASLGRADRTGSLEAGKRADLCVLDVPNYRHLCYEFGRNPVRSVVAGGVVVVSDRRALPPHAGS